MLTTALQVGVGVPGGCEAAVHATLRFLHVLPDNKVIAKLDFSNAFNTIKRSSVLEAVHSKMPEIFNYCQLSYGSSSRLRYGKYTVLSSEGVQQGDPIGPLLFCLTIHPLLSQLNSDFKNRLLG